MDIERENHIQDRLRGKVHLLPVLFHSLNVPERLKEYDPDLFCVFNLKRKRYEVHSLDNKGNTYCFTVPGNELDSRVFSILRSGSIRNRGKEIFREMDRENERREESAERSRRNEILAAASEMKSSFAKVAWGEV